MRRASCIIALGALIACGRVTDGYFSGPSGTTTAGGVGHALPSPSPSSSPQGISSPGPTSSPTSTPVAVVCDDMIIPSNNAATYAMADAAIPGTAVIVMGVPGDTNTRLSVYITSTPAGPSTTSYNLSPIYADTPGCDPCLVATYNGRPYIAQSGVLKLDFSSGITGNTTLSLTNVTLAPADGVGGRWCIAHTTQTTTLAPYRCDMSPTTGSCLTIELVSAAVSCSSNTLSVLQDCSATGRRCVVGVCR